jgi:deazaflavin-dependent oxidoreductase (nitroreductase family)
MGLQQELGYQVRPANAAQRAVQRVAATRGGAWCFARTARPLDVVLLRATRGRTTLAAVTAGIPVLTLTTTGRKTGRARIMPLLGVPTGDDLAVVGTNFGREHEPAWCANLRSDPRATIEYHGTRVAAVARDATPTERDAILRLAAGIYPGYDRYRERITTRAIPVLVLEPAAAD